ncbi:MAG: acetolactate synthase, large subunit, biosynthetic type [Omnitrophica WOR_2 bacterium GWF2_43_52]|nr:MAG: acetolactate synthase, large subunit, biosynthetic type [Omnitrophica WOR_2 bacterium GWC2_44_8]OGX20788.1 MAG: acetolactate synthase, large subunit, biosynthetic type [Omnitrophica WOR_2 bacterium GWF2_43_52]OGX54271.1 MAG: acetolactate synthase, large subunit, biosynthetic type [Omnitrophica WOR_2 bacterium RIFOXYC2_FULL_43_9]HAH19815.1 biosynthetic-type acetolactate synthase large subunit [Candidatus Omnitrophota bacterium]HBG63440.1 biosynthetic-type acetolactate synthase large subu
MTGAQILIECLEREGVEVMFGYPGGVVLPIFDKLYDSKIRFILTRHEQGAAHAADGYARATGKVGVCLATSGPGATNLTTGIANAYMDSIPMVAITGQVKTFLIGNDAFQEADITGITRSISKHNYLVKDVKDLALVVREAFHLALTGRPGPVVIDLPVDVQQAECDFLWPQEVFIRGYKPTLFGHPGQIKKAARLIAASKRPILYIGGGVIISGAHQEVKELAETILAPVTMTMMGLGAFPGTHELSLGMLGMHGTAYANHATMESDLIIAIGARFDDRVTGRVSSFAPHAKIIHIDIDPTSISKTVRVDIPIVGDAKNILGQLLEEIKKKPDTKKWLEQVKEWKAKHPLRYRDEGNRIKPQFVIEQIYEVTKGEAIITTEVGQNQMWSCQWYKYTKPRTFISSGGLGTMGFGFPAAMGVKVACPDKIVFDIAGDGSIQMNSQELMTVVCNKIPVKIAILNNGYLGMVRQWQELFYKKRYSSVKLCNPDFVKLAESYGAVGMRITKKEDVRAAIKKAIAIDNTVMLDFVVEEEENVYPMVPAGEAINRMIGGMA